MKRIDIHGHYQPNTLMTEKTGIGQKIIDNQFFLDMGYPIGPITEGMWNLDKRFEEMRSFNIDQQLLSAVPSTFGYNREVDNTVSYTHAYNQELGKLQDQYPNKFIAFGSLPLQAPDKARTEIEYGAESLGLKGFEIGTSVNGKQLDDSCFDVVYQKCEELKMPLLLHPHISGPLSIPYNRFNFKVVVYFPLQTTLAAATLVYGGVLERFPDLKIILAHGGGLYPYQKGRFDHAFAVRTKAYPQISQPPSSYFKKFYYDSITHDAAALQFFNQRIYYLAFFNPLNDFALLK